jgi:hypothetical protein
MVLGVSTVVLYMLYVGVGIGMCIGGIGVRGV